MTMGGEKTEGGVGSEEAEEKQSAKGKHLGLGDVLDDGILGQRMKAVGRVGWR